MSEQSLREALLFWLKAQGGEVREEGDNLTFTRVLAERRTFLARRKTTLYLHLEIHEQKKELLARLSLAEKGSGLPLESGVGGRLEIYKLGRKRTGKVTEDLRFLFERYRLSFDYTAFQREIENLAKEHSYATRWESLAR